jgi:hypothetical protein
LVSFIAVHAGAFAYAVEKVRMQAPDSEPSVSLPAMSDPTILAPLPHPAPRLGVPANAVADSRSAAALVSIMASVPVLRKLPFRIITAPCKNGPDRQ